MRHLVNLSRVIYGADEATDGLTNQKFVSEACDADQVQAMGKLDPTKGAQDLTNYGYGLSADGVVGTPIGNPLKDMTQVLQGLIIASVAKSSSHRWLTLSQLAKSLQSIVIYKI
jgi:hypothetical protein